MTDEQRLVRMLGGNDLAWLVDRVRRRMSRGEQLTGTVTLADATAEQRMAVQRLLGRRPRPGRALTVSLPAVDEVLRRSGACADGLAGAVVVLGGEVPDLVNAGAERERHWAAAVEPLTALAARRLELAEWCTEIVRTGLVRRLSGSAETAARLVDELVGVVERLPADGVALATFAATVTGRAHALDDGQPLATLALGAARTLADMPTGAGAEWRREVWASVGLLRDDLSTSVLTLGLTGDAASATGKALAAWHAAGQPVLLTLRQLVHEPPRLAYPTVFVCENPAVVSTAADRLGARCAPLVCTSGQPSAAVMHLLRQASATGTELRFHADFDWGGVHIGNLVYERVGFRPWRFRITDYLAAAGRGRELTGRRVEARWDPDLAAALARTTLAVEEEQVVDDLVTDLRCDRPCPEG